MNLLLFFLIFGFFALGFLVFSFSAGMILFRSICLRKVYTRASVIDRAAHVRDRRIMDTLLAAKNRWNERPLEKVLINSKKSLKKIRLAADLWLQADLKLPFVILVHGFSDSAAGLAFLAEAYYERGFSVLAVNLRAHGESGGDYAGLGHIKTDGADLSLWVNYLLERFGADRVIIMHGMSMGAAALIQYAYDKNAVPIRLIVADCPFCNFANQVKNNFTQMFSKSKIQVFIAASICAAASCINFCINGFFLFQNSPIGSLKNCKTESPPLLLFQGTNDTMVSPHAAQKLYETAVCKKKLVMIEGAPHIGSWFYDPELYMKTVLEQL